MVRRGAEGLRGGKKGRSETTGNQGSRADELKKKRPPVRADASKLRGGDEALARIIRLREGEERHR
jgi:hypothetical protein